MTPFHELPNRTRMAARYAIDAAGGSVAGYRGPYVQAAIPDPSGPFFEAMESAGLELDERSLHYFPLGTDAPPAALRHHGGYWLFGNFSAQP
jgi:hypothetical protein